jgi:phage FluMu protein Com
MCEHEFSATGDKITCLKCGKEFTRDEFLTYLKSKATSTDAVQNAGVTTNTKRRKAGTQKA